MNFNYLRYLKGEVPMKSGSLQIATGHFECPVCYSASNEAMSDGIKVYWTCKNGHENAVNIND